MTSIIFKRIFGLLILIIGISIIGWFIYNQFFPTNEFKKSFRSIFQLIVPIAFIGMGWKWFRYEGKGIDQITPPNLDCQELKDSVINAKESISNFLSEVENGIDGAYIKFPLNTPKGLTEHIWAYVHFYRDGQFNVSIANQSYDDQQDTSGRRNVPINDVEDWQIMQADGKLKGAYSLIALFRYHEGKGIKLSPLMRKQKAQLLDV